MTRAYSRNARKYIKHEMRQIESGELKIAPGDDIHLLAPTVSTGPGPEKS